ncbi:MaoC family dehydratase N-terminal domain-containing protein [Microbacteriaceae bacterium 4G12]
MKTGTVLNFEQTFTTEDIIQFISLAGYESNELMSDGCIYLMLQGLLTATLPTKVGSEYGFIAWETSFTFTRPVFTGDTIHCKVHITETITKNDHLCITIEFLCTNQHDCEVLKGQFLGSISQ